MGLPQRNTSLSLAQEASFDPTISSLFAASVPTGPPSLDHTHRDTSPDLEHNKASNKKRKYRQGKTQSEALNNAGALFKKKKTVNDAEQSPSTNSQQSETESGSNVGSDSISKVDDIAESSDAESLETPIHESLASSHTAESELDKAARTVFLGNVSTEAVSSKSAKKTLMRHLASFIPSLQASASLHKVESLRFRSTAFGSSMPKKGAFARKIVMNATTKSTNAYAVYSTKLAAKEAVNKLNGTIVLGRHLRVDRVAHPAQVDHLRCVFVGNLGFVDDETEASDEANAKKKPPADTEEGLWQHFGKVGDVESVRVIRDEKTRVGKGFAYVQFRDQNAVESALLYDGKKFPPLLPRKLRVTRAKAMKRNARKSFPGPANLTSHPNPRQVKLYGKAAASRLKTHKGLLGGRRESSSGGRSDEFTFEGHRATSKPKTTASRSHGSKKFQERRTSHGGKRAAAWRSSQLKKSTD